MEQLFDAIRTVAGQHQQEAIAIRRKIHQHPEMANMEVRTSAWVARHLRGIGVDEVYEGLAGGTGVIGILHGAHDGPTVGLRGDMDAQAVREQSGLPFSSQDTCQWGEETLPVTHCCGHDVHTAMLMTTATVLAQLRNLIRGKVMFVFQPAEEGPSPGWKGLHGAQAMVQEPIFQKNKPEAMLALHVDPKQPIGTAGELSFAAGQTCMAISAFSIELTGIGGHNATPWQGVDTLLPAAQILQALQHVVTRNVNPNNNRVVLTVGQLSGGTKYNIIADRAVIRGACRFSDYQTRAFLEGRIQDIVTGTALAGNVQGKLIWDMHYPPNFNSQQLMDQMAPRLERTLGVGKIINQGVRCQHVPDDFSYYTLEIPSIYALLSCSPDTGDLATVPGLHSPDMIVNERCIPKGIEALVTFALTYSLT